MIGARRAAIEVRHGGDTGLEANVAARRAGRASGSPTPDSGRAPSRGFRIDDNMLGGVEQGMVLQGVIDSRVRGNIFDGVGDGLVVDGTGHGTEVSGNVFLRAERLVHRRARSGGGRELLGHGRRGARAAARVRGRVSVLPWKPASAAGY